MLVVESLHASYSGIRALRGVSLRVEKGEMVALIGPNGAGKSTLINCISGIVPVQRGRIELSGQPLDGMTSWAISRLGLQQVPEGRQVWPEMTVLENLALGGTALRRRAARYTLERIYDLFPILAQRQSQLAGSLSGGQQQMLAIGRALMGSPQMLLLDEPSLGLAPLVVKQVFDALVQLNREGLTILLVEQNSKLALSTSHRAYVIEQGSIAHEGPSSQLKDDPQVIAHYLGQSTS
ncbi:MAG: ABC transporter ATP-binding protein [Rhodoferax sp.]|nr:ABC transporter ATP-binding protein [Rhodoferax sp.]